MAKRSELRAKPVLQSWDGTASGSNGAHAFRRAVSTEFRTSSFSRVCLQRLGTEMLIKELDDDVVRILRFRQVVENE